MGLKSLISKLESFDINEASEMAIMDTDKELARIQQDQLYSGKLSTGGWIFPQYSPSTKVRKRKKGQPTDRVTLKDTGAFYKGIFIDVRGDIFVIDSSDEYGSDITGSKRDKLVEKYGVEIFGLNKDSKVEYIKTLKKALLKRCSTVIKLK
jgi:hypothetical protein